MTYLRPEVDSRDHLDALVATIPHDLCRWLCRYFWSKGWHIEVVGHTQARATSPHDVGGVVGSIDLWEITAWLTTERINRETRR